MVSERIRRRVDALLDEADAASARRDWSAVIEAAEAALGFEPDNEDAKSYVSAAHRALRAGGAAAETSL
jgi:hypothetical protein